jgi:hypothetical protein
MNSLLTTKRVRIVADTMGNSVIARDTEDDKNNQQFLKVMSLPPDPPLNNNDVILNLIFDIQWSRKG